MTLTLSTRQKAGEQSSTCKDRIRVGRECTVGLNGEHGVKTRRCQAAASSGTSARRPFVRRLVAVQAKVVAYDLLVALASYQLELVVLLVVGGPRATSVQVEQVRIVAGDDRCGANAAPCKCRE